MGGPRGGGRGGKRNKEGGEVLPPTAPMHVYYCNCYYYIAEGWGQKRERGKARRQGGSKKGSDAEEKSIPMLFLKVGTYGTATTAQCM